VPCLLKPSRRFLSLLNFIDLKGSIPQKEIIYLQIPDNWYWKMLKKKFGQTVFRNTFLAVVMLIFKKIVV